ncbi:MAG: aldo/keto reductase, partial [Acidimicrobiales bacterium]
MRYVEVGGARLSVIGLGTWQFGSWEWGYGQGYAEGEAGAIVERALDLGINLIDTAELYGFGESERIVGRAIAGRRDEAFIATKFLPLLPGAGIVASRARASAGRLGVTRIDGYQLHFRNPLVPLGPAMAGARRLQQEGLVVHAGVSNFSLRAWQAAELALGGPVLTNQVKYNLLARRPEHDLLAFARAAGRVVIAYSPLAKGLLSGRYDGSRRPAGLRSLSPGFSRAGVERAAPVLR